MRLHRPLLFAATALLGVSSPAQDAQQPSAPPAQGVFRESAAALSQPKNDVNANSLNVYGIYSEARDMEREISEMYKEVRAMELSLIQRQLLEKSLKNVQVPVSERAEVSQKILEGKAMSADDVESYQKELKTVMRETDAIVANSREMLDSLLPKPAEEPQAQETQQAQEQSQASESSSEEVSKAVQQQVAAMVDSAEKLSKEAKTELEKALENLKQAEKFVKQKKEDLEKEKKELEKKPEAKEAKEAKEVKEKKELEEKIEKVGKAIETAEVAVKEAIQAVELKAETLEKKVENANKAMEKLYEALDLARKTEELAKETKEDKLKVTTVEAKFQIKNASEMMKEAAETLEQAQALQSGKLSGDMKVATIQALEILSRAAAGHYLDISKQMQGVALDKTPQPVLDPKFQPPSIKDYFKGQFGRKIVASGGEGAVWFYLDQWYLIGPYDNAGRKNIETVFPPQSIVDLDAVYSGKGGKQLVWQYDSFSTPMIWPGFVDEYTIYYGYTELWCDADMDLWLAVGSDDRSDLWINDYPVWRSSNRLKGWRIDEGFRKVHFRKGRNKILFRLENGWHHLAMSILICTHDPRQAAQ